MASFVVAATYQGVQPNTMCDISTRRRPITSCLECYRRKQKCNRRQPCNHCLNRKVPDRCYFSHDASQFDETPALEQTPLTAPRLAQEQSIQDVHVDVGATPANWPDQGGGHGTPISGTSQWTRVQPSPPWGSAYSESPRNRRNTYSDYVARLPPHEKIMALLELFFGELYWTFTAVDENQFLNAYHHWRSTPATDYDPENTPDRSQRERQCFPALLFQVLAQALQGLSSQYRAAAALGLKTDADCDHLSQTFHQTGNQLAYLLGRHGPTVCSVEHELVSACWLKNAGQGTEMWYRLGRAVMQARALGLHRLPPCVDQPPDNSVEVNLLRIWEHEHQKRMWVRIFILDSYLALTLGKPRLLHREDCTTPAPLKCEYPKDPARTIPIPCDDSPLVTNHLVIFALSHKLHDVLSLSADGTFSRDYAKVLTLHHDICSLRENLPRPARVQVGPSPPTDARTGRFEISRLRTLNHFNIVLVALHRPFVGSRPASRTAAVNAALEQLDLQHAILELIPPSQRRMYTNAFYTVEAATFLCGLVTEMPPKDPVESRRIKDAIGQSIKRLDVIEDKGPLTESGEQVLRLFYQKIRSEETAAPSFVEDPQACMAPNDHFLDHTGPGEPRPTEQAFQTLFTDHVQNVMAPLSSTGYAGSGLEEESLGALQPSLGDYNYQDYPGLTEHNLPFL